MGVVEASLTRLNCIAENMTDRMKRLHSDALSRIVFTLLRRLYESQTKTW